MATISGEPRARRTHARRSCDLCKVRKTRCELPDLDVPSSSTPLPTDKSCHRCRVLALPCVVDDSRMAKRRKKVGTPMTSSGGVANTATSAGGPSGIGPVRSVATRKSRTPAPHSKTGSSPLGEGSVPRRQQSSVSRQSSRPEGTPAPVNPVDHNVDISTTNPMELDPSRTSARHTVRMHGRPLTITAGMLNIAYAKMFEGLGRQIVVVDDGDLERLIEPVMRTRLAAGFAQLRTIHPHLQNLNELLGMYRESPADTPIQLLLTSTVYIAAQSLGSDSDGRRLRDELAPVISHLLQLVLAHQTSSFHAIQALEVLSLHVPFAPALPLQLTDPRTLAPARGLIGAACNISDMLNFNALVNSPIEHWPNPDYWLWLGVRIGEAQMALEDERPRKPALLSEARASAMELIAPDKEGLWTSVSFAEDSAELLGKLTVCDRLARLDELHDSLGRLRVVVDTASNVPNYNAVQGILDEVDHFGHRIAAVDKRHDDVLALLALPLSLSSAWQSYRTIRRRFETMKQYLVAFQFLVALHFLPGSVIALPNLPVQLTSARAVHSALNRAYDPSEVLRAQSSNSAAADDLRRISRTRGDMAEQQLSSFIELSHSILPTHGGAADIIPLHDTIAVVLESAKSLVELHASRLSLIRQFIPIQTAIGLPRWANPLTQVGHIMRKISMPHDEAESDGGESVANGCANLVGSMVRTVNMWTAHIEREIAYPVHPTVRQVPMSFSASPQLPPQQMRPVTPILLGPVPSPSAGGPSNFSGGYMPSSDRWLSADHGEGASGKAGPSGGITEFGQHLVHPPSALPTPMTAHHPGTQQQSMDNILSDMFGYGYAPPVGPGSVPHAPPGGGPGGGVYTPQPPHHLPSPDDYAQDYIAPRELSPHVQPVQMPPQLSPGQSQVASATGLLPQHPSVPSHPHMMMP